MIYGIQAAQPDSGSSGGVSYPGALAVMDFILGQYLMSDVVVLASDMIDRAHAIDANGLYVNWSVDESPAYALGAFLALLLTVNWTIVIEVREDAAGAMIPVAIENATSGGDSIWIASNNTQVDAWVRGSVGANAFKSSIVARPAVRRIAFTRTSSNLAISVNGGTVNADTTAQTIGALLYASFGGRPLDGGSGGGVDFLGYIRRVIVYSPQADSELPGLSA